MILEIVPGPNCLYIAQNQSPYILPDEAFDLQDVDDVYPLPLDYKFGA